MSEVASAYVSLIPSAKGFGRRTESIMNGELASTGTSAGRSIGGRLVGGVGSVLKGGLIGVGAAGAGLLGTALFKGFGRLTGIEQAQAKLKGLGHETKAVEKIMKNATNAVTGTAFGLDSAATVAASSVAAGVKPGAQLERTLSLVADSSTIAGTSMDEMGLIFNKVASTGKVQGEVIAQLGERGIPILQLLGKQLGKTPAEVSEMAAAGKIGFATFQDAMEKGMGGAAQASGKTFSGAMANTQAALGRLGAKVLGPIFAALPPLLTGVMTSLDSLGPMAERVGGFMMTAFTAAAGAVRSVDWGAILGVIKGVFNNIVGAIQSVDWVGIAAVVKGVFVSVADAIRGVDWAGIGATIKGVFDGIVSAVQSVDWGGLSTIIGAVVSALLPLAAFTFGALVTAFQAVGSIVGPTLGFAVDVINLLIAAVQNPIIQAAAVAIGTALGLLAIPIVVLNAQMLLLVARAALMSAATTAWTAITGAATAAQGLLNAVMAMNPIALIVIALIALAAGLVVAYKKSETFRNIVDGAFSAIKSVAQTVARFFVEKIPAAFGKVKDAAGAAIGWVKANWSKILAFLTGPIGLAVGLIVSKWDLIVAGAKKVLSGVKSAFNKVLNFVKGIPGKVLSALGDLGSLLLDSGKALLEGFKKGITDGFEKVKGAVKDGMKKVRDFFPFSPAKKGAFSGKGYTTHSGKALMVDFGKGVTGGTASAVKAMREAMMKTGKAGIKGLQAAMKKAKSELDRVTSNIDMFGAIRDQVAGVFSPDMFSGSIAQVMKGLGQQKVANRQALVDWGKLKTLGLDPKFLTALMASGNTGLISAFAADASLAQQAQTDWLDIQSSSSALGDSVAQNELGKTMKSLQKNSDALNKMVDKLPDEIAKRINHAAKKGKKDGKKK